MLMSFTEQDRPLRLSGTMGLEKKNLDMVLDLPWKLMGLNDKVVTSVMPGGIQIPVGGTATAPQFNASEVVQKNLLQKGPQNILKNLPGLLNKGKDSSGQNTPSDANPAQPASPTEDPIRALGNLFKKKDKDKDPKKSDQ